MNVMELIMRLRKIEDKSKEVVTIPVDTETSIVSDITETEEFVEIG